MAPQADTTGMFLTVEGIDGAGKSTQARLLAIRLRGLGHDVIETREPGGSTGAEEIRRLLVEPRDDDWSAQTEILLFTAARRDHLEKVIDPALKAGHVVLCDRFVDSTRAYQGTARGIVDQLHDLMIGRLPDLTLLFDIDPEAAVARAVARGDGEDRFEQRGLAFQRQLRTAFLDLAAGAPERIAVIDADADADAVSARVWNVVKGRLDG